MRRIAIAASLSALALAGGCSQMHPAATPMSGTTTGSAGPEMKRQSRDTAGSSGTMAIGTATLAGGSGERPEIDYDTAAGSAGT